MKIRGTCAACAGVDDGVSRPHSGRIGLDRSGGPRLGRAAPAGADARPRCGPRRSGRPAATSSATRRIGLRTGWINSNDHCPSALVGLLRSACGLSLGDQLLDGVDRQLQTEGTWLGAFLVGAIQLQGQSACLDELYFYEEAFTTWICLACQPNPKQKDIDRILIGEMFRRRFRTVKFCAGPGCRAMPVRLRRLRTASCRG